MLKLNQKQKPPIIRLGALTVNIQLLEILVKHVTVSKPEDSSPLGYNPLDRSVKIKRTKASAINAQSLAISLFEQRFEVHSIGSNKKQDFRKN
ncbi:hypothetical protein QQ056_19585 [Oscillatoria laete-virens NRMC-F 0139]|nr:hypothetical protein [Oscillatoria laete-virens NRMC-F 0139]